LSIQFKIARRLLESVRKDLTRPHRFAFERVGFISAGLSSAADNLWILARSYRPVADDDYLDDPSVGAMMGPEAIRKALQWAMSERVAIFHVHTHHGHGEPGFSGVDLREQAKFVPTFFQIAPQCPHGALVLSDDAAYGHIWLDGEKPLQAITGFVEVGSPIKTWNHV
jgi:hypothetical protein